MRGNDDVAHRPVRVLAAGLILLALALATAAPASASPAHPTPTTSAPSTTPAGRSLPLTIKLGKIQIGVTLPLTPPGLLGRTGTPPASSSAPTTPPTTSPPTSPPTSLAPTTSRGSTTGPYPPTLPKPAESASNTPWPATGGAGPSGAAATHTSSGGDSATPAPSKTRPVGRASSKETGLVFVRRLVPSGGPMLFILLCIACAAGVAAVVKLSGGRRRL